MALDAQHCEFAANSVLKRDAYTPVPIIFLRDRHLVTFYFILTGTNFVIIHSWLVMNNVRLLKLSWRPSKAKSRRRDQQGPVESRCNFRRFRQRKLILLFVRARSSSEVTVRELFRWCVSMRNVIREVADLLRAGASVVLK
jgi:hypothetical protein